MIQFATLFFLTILALSKTPKRLAAENIALRHQVSVLRRKRPGRIQVSRIDRMFLSWLAKVCPSVLDAIVIVKPETVLRWHRHGFRLLWRWKSRNLGGRPIIDKELREIIKMIACDNPLWGAPRIHGELLKLGFGVSESTVSKYLKRTYRPSGQSWKTFINNHKDAVAAVDLFTVPTASFKILYGIAILHLGSRKLVWTNATYHPTADWIANQVSQAFPWETAPQYLVRDRDASYGRVFKRRLDSMGIRDRPTAFRSPWQNGYVERVIGSIRRECLDHTIIFGEAHLRRTLKNYARYYNRARTHLSLDKNSPIPRPVEHDGDIAKRQHLGGLHHEYRRMK
ncbi:MAG: transposase [Alphaproteobacteria bacterium]|nr:transposase [Alphaproteobacteria bacterium]